MEVVRVQPIDRLPNLSNDIAPNLMYNLPRYFCPHCSEYSVFETGNPASSPFSIETAALFDKFIGPQDLEGWKKSDFFVESARARFGSISSTLKFLSVKTRMATSPAQCLKQSEDC